MRPFKGLSFGKWTRSIGNAFDALRRAPRHLRRRVKGQPIELKLLTLVVLVFIGSMFGAVLALALSINLNIL